MGLAANELIEPPVEVTETFVPRNASTVIEPAAVTVTNWPTALPVWVIVPPPRPEKAACMVMLPDAAVRIVRAVRKPKPAARLTSPPPLFRLHAWRSALAVKLMLAP